MTTEDTLREAVDAATERYYASIPFKHYGTGGAQRYAECRAALDAAVEALAAFCEALPDEPPSHYDIYADDAESRLERLREIAMEDGRYDQEVSHG